MMGLRRRNSAWVQDPARCSHRRVIPADVPRCATPLPGRSIIPVREAVVMHARAVAATSLGRGCSAVGANGRRVHSYGSIPGVTTHIGGSVQPLAGGRTLVSFGTEGRVEEYDAQGRLTWSTQGNAGYVFRAQRIRSLYAPGVGTAR